MSRHKATARCTHELPHTCVVPYRVLNIVFLVVRFALGALLIGSSILDWREGSVFAVIIGVFAIGSGVVQIVRARLGARARAAHPEPAETDLN